VTVPPGQSRDRRGETFDDTVDVDDQLASENGVLVGLDRNVALEQDSNRCTAAAAHARGSVHRPRAWMTSAPATTMATARIVASSRHPPARRQSS
jgi:hypothetical protein